MALNEHFWNQRYEENTTSWDIGVASPPLEAIIRSWRNKNSRILIPGCGNAYEAQLLVQLGFTNITLLDISDRLIESLTPQFAQFPQVQVVHGDFFSHYATYDLILEQTFFCAIDPSHRTAYVQKMHELLAPDGVLAGVLFNCHFDGGPPFGGSIEEYKTLFEPLFTIRQLEPCTHSIPQRSRREASLYLVGNPLGVE